MIHYCTDRSEQQYLSIFIYKKLSPELSYANSAKSRIGKTFITCLENVTGRSTVLSRLPNSPTAIHSTQNFWHSIMEGYGVTIDIMQGELENIPVDQPLIVVANHPYGILDGLVMGSILAKSAANFKIIANDIFKAYEIKYKILFSSFKNNRDAIALNLQTRKNALTHLHHAGAIGIFPGATVSTSSKLFSQPADPVWKSFTAKMIFKLNASVIPIFFDGNTSRIFQLARHLNPSLRAGLLLREFKLRLEKPVRIAIGRPIPRCRMDLFKMTLEK